MTFTFMTITTNMNGIRKNFSFQKNSFTDLCYERNKNSTVGVTSSISASEFNEYLCKVADQITSNLPKINKLPEELLRKRASIQNSFFIPSVTSFEILTTIKSFTNSACYEVYGLNTIIL